MFARTGTICAHGNANLLPICATAKSKECVFDYYLDGFSHHVLGEKFFTIQRPSRIVSNILPCCNTVNLSTMTLPCGAGFLIAKASFTTE